jgi:hypothetical protein
MSKNQKLENSQNAQVDASLPEGFVLNGSRNGVGWFNQSKIGNTCLGTLIGMFNRPDALKTKDGKLGESDFFQVELKEPCEVRAETGANAHMVTAQAGDVVNVNYGPKTKPWKDLVSQISQGASFEVFARVIGDKVPIKGGAQKMHNLLVGSKLVSAAQSTGGEASSDSAPDEVGF